MKFEIDPLPYGQDALAPHIGAQTVDVHYNRHHKGYMTKLASEIEGGPLGDLPLDELVRSAPPESSIYRNAAQVWNHTFYWNSLSPDGGGSPDGRIASLLKRDFGSADQFRSTFAEAAASRFGSGWAWLVADENGRLSVTTTSNAGNPMRDAQLPLLTLDVWEHAYYLDYQNERADYIEACLEHLLNWKFAEANFELVAAAARSNSAVA